TSVTRAIINMRSGFGLQLARVDEVEAFPCSVCQPFQCLVLAGVPLGDSSSGIKRQRHTGQVKALGGFFQAGAVEQVQAASAGYVLPIPGPVSGFALRVISG